jgi:hypothetical protein
MKVPKASAYPDQDFRSLKPRGMHPLDSRDPMKIDCDAD